MNCSKTLQIKNLNCRQSLQLTNTPLKKQAPVFVQNKREMHGKVADKVCLLIIQNADKVCQLITPIDLFLFSFC